MSEFVLHLSEFILKMLELLEDVLFSNTAAATAVTARMFNFRCGLAAHFIYTFRTWYGPMHKAFAALPADKAALSRAI